MVHSIKIFTRRSSTRSVGSEDPSVQCNCLKILSGTGTSQSRSMSQMLRSQRVVHQVINSAVPRPQSKRADTSNSASLQMFYFLAGSWQDRGVSGNKEGVFVKALEDTHISKQRPLPDLKTTSVFAISSHRDVCPIIIQRRAISILRDLLGATFGATLLSFVSESHRGRCLRLEAVHAIALPTK